MTSSTPTTPSIVLSHANYGKSAVRLVKVTRDGDRHDLRDLNVDVMLDGDFSASYVDGDNRAMLATDTMRNTIYALAKDDPIESIEAFGMRLAQHFLKTGPTVTGVQIRIVEYPWNRIAVNGQEHEHAFTRGAGERVAVISVDAAGMTVQAGIDNLLILKTTNSGWEDFYREQYTTLPDARDRILATVLTADWTYTSAHADFERLWSSVRDQILVTFTDHYSPSVQNTLFRMGKAVLESHPDVQKIHFSLPNKHHLLFDLARFGMENDNQIFHVTNDPFGLIEGTVERSQ
ncbi:MAG TPA: urate oxidase [Roseiflexaceae bacterium]|jgi:urate oxidase|nr:urate oxidase [Roseiflexaceae bacterium]